MIPSHGKKFKDYPDRVLSTYHFLKNASIYLAKNTEEIRLAREVAKSQTQNKKSFVLSWEPDTTKYEFIPFKGYEIKYRTSQVTGMETYYFDRESPWEMPVKNYAWYKPVKTTLTPDFYILPTAWKEVVERMKINGVEMHTLQKDTQMVVEYYYIDDFKTVPNPYNGHYSHSGVKIRKEKGPLNFITGDLCIPMNQKANEFIIQVLEPESTDSSGTNLLFHPKIQHFPIFKIAFQFVPDLNRTHPSGCSGIYEIPGFKGHKP